MLVQLGARSDSLDVIDLLLDCHAKIRRFLVISKRLAASDSSNVADIHDTAASIARYFIEAFPLHVADEAELLLPRLIGRDEHVDAALATMRDDHTAHQALVDSFSGLCTKLADEPERLAALAPELRGVVIELEPLIEGHLVMEETVIFPALRLLDADEKRAMVAAMRERRALP